MTYNPNSKRFGLLINGRPLKDLKSSKTIVFKSWALAVYVMLSARNQMPIAFEDSEIISLTTDD